MTCSGLCAQEGRSKRGPGCRSSGSAKSLSTAVFPSLCGQMTNKNSRVSKRRYCYKSLCGVFTVLLMICLALDPELLRGEVLVFLRIKHDANLTLFLHLKCQR